MLKYRVSYFTYFDFRAQKFHIFKCYIIYFSLILHFRQILLISFTISHNINVEGLLLSCPWLCRCWLLKPLPFDPPWHQKHAHYCYWFLFSILLYMYIQMDGYKVSHRAMGPKHYCQSVSTMNPPFWTCTDISARRSESPGIFLSNAGV